MVNPALLRLVGYRDAGELNGHPVLDLVASSEKAVVQEYASRRESGAPAPSSYETRGVRRDGGEFDIEADVAMFTLNGRRNNLFIAAQRWEDSERALAYINALEKSWRDSAVGELSPAQSQWLAWARDEARKVAPSAENYPDPESVQRCDPAAIPVGGPYPTMTKLKRSEFSREEPKPESSPYSSYPGYSRY